MEDSPTFVQVPIPLKPRNLKGSWFSRSALQCEAPKIAFNWFITSITMVYGTYNELVAGANLNQLITGGAHFVCVDIWMYINWLVVFRPTPGGPHIVGRICIDRSSRPDYSWPTARWSPPICRALRPSWRVCWPQRHPCRAASGTAASEIPTI